ncbi:hypothetical protein [Palleronia sp. LCG004]|uniref:hypothetical protein n=1 Tax=Palleronia sp. LCG004 TaxID=3079304 RepID=UPI002942E8E3|nr:hypothetical protein [Palleronia sp. LCG004]WOI56797.1 hypothetical protein RVY76_03095 [Palleronia sp. LCG004]
MFALNSLTSSLGYKPKPTAPLEPVAETSPKAGTQSSLSEQPAATPQSTTEGTSVAPNAVAPAAPVKSTAIVPAESSATSAEQRPAETTAMRANAAGRDDGLVRDLPGAIAADLGAIAMDEDASRAAAESARTALRVSMVVEGMSSPVVANGAEPVARDPAAQEASDRYDSVRPAIDTVKPERLLAKVA